MPSRRIAQGRHSIGFWALALACALLTGCGLPYYTQAVGGEWAIMRHERPIKTVLREPGVAPAIKERLRYVARLRRFARRDLSLPVGGNYREYADLHRPYVVWNVFAARPFTLRLKRWCFPFAGCVAYRGYFAKRAAVRYADHLRRAGYEVFVGGVPAFATLGYLDDPVLSTFLDYPHTTIAHIIFHELAHDLIYIPNATTFDESFADTVAAVGVARFLKRYGTAAQWRAYQRRRRWHREVIALMTACRRRLARIYHDPTLDAAQRGVEKRQAYRALHQGFMALVAHWHGSHGYRAFFRQHFNNALLGAYMSYEGLVPAFERLLRLEDGNLPAFFRAVRWYGRLPDALRDGALRSRSGLVERLPALYETQRRAPTERRRHALVRPQGAGLAGTIQNRPHDETQPF